jgi:hypothetical protein
MKTSTTYISRLAVFVVFSLIALSLVALSGRVKAQDQKDGVSFKVPDGFMQVPISNFRGMMMLDPKKPAGLFVIYPNDNETMDTLRQRILAFVGPMFIHDEKLKAETAIAWDTKTLPAHEDDGAGKAAANFYGRANDETQVAIYERATGSKPVLYGYFAMRHKPGKDDDGKFLDEQGQGVKAFDKLWKSFRSREKP